jgi:hypothetical protein
MIPLLSSNSQNGVPNFAVLGYVKGRIIGTIILFLTGVFYRLSNLQQPFYRLIIINFF